MPNKKKILIDQIILQSKEIFKEINKEEGLNIFTEEVRKKHIKEVRKEVATLTDTEVEIWLQKFELLEV